MKRKKNIAAVFFACSLLLNSVAVQAAAEPAESSEVRQNIEKLTKTKSCPGCNLAGANLNRADLSGADLQGADLTQAKFFLTNLSGANLQNAKLKKAGFGGADLANANLRGADLAGANLDGAYLKGARFDKEFAALLRADAQKTADIEEEMPAVSSEPKVEDGVEPKQEPSPATPQKKAIEETPQIPIAAKDKVQRPPAVDSVPEAAGVAQEKRPSPDPGLTKKKLGLKKAVQPPMVAVVAPDAPPVKTVHPMGEAVIAEPEEIKNEPEVVAEKSVASADPGGMATQSEKVSEADQDKVAVLLKSKSCYGCDLSGLDLSGKNLKGADLEKANLSGCNLEGAHLDKANLKGAQLIRANLKGASLKSADLYKADFSGADLTGAKMQKALADEALFTNAIGVSEEILKEKK